METNVRPLRIISAAGRMATALEDGNLIPLYSRFVLFSIPSIGWGVFPFHFSSGNDWEKWLSKSEKSRALLRFGIEKSLVTGVLCVGEVSNSKA